MGDAKKIALQVLESAGIAVGGDRPWDIHVHDDGLWERVLAERELGLGESYMDGWWDVEALDEFLIRLLMVDARRSVRLGPLVVARAAVGAYMFNRQTKRRAASNASAHYDIGNDLYERMLDKRMIYSCGYWADADDLDSAQEAKLDLICRKLHLESGMHVLDIGCGWGGFAAFAAERYQVKVTGITPAIEQVKLARRRTAGLDVDIRRNDYREVTGTFDRIVSIGMFEHVGHKNYRRFFTDCDRLLAPDGMMLHHTIGSNRSTKTMDPWVDKYIFPGGELPALAQMARAAEPDFTVEDAHNFGPYYDRTLQAWRDNIEARWDEIPGYDERFRRMWRYYLAASMAGFRVRNIQLWQVVFSRTMRRSGVYQSVR